MKVGVLQVMSLSSPSLKLCVLGATTINHDLRYLKVSPVDAPIDAHSKSINVSLEIPSQSFVINESLWSQSLPLVVSLEIIAPLMISE